MKVLSFLPCNPGTRCGYIRVDRQKKLLIDRPRRQPQGQSDQGAAGREDQARLGLPRRLRSAQPEAPVVRAGDAGRQDPRHGDRRPLSLRLRHLQSEHEPRRTADHRLRRSRQCQAGRDLACAGSDQGRAVRAAQPQQPRRQAADRPVPRDQLSQRSALSRLARRRHAGARHQGPHRAEARSPATTTCRPITAASSAPRTRRCRSCATRASIPISSCTPTRSSTARRGSAASSTCPISRIRKSSRASGRPTSSCSRPSAPSTAGRLRPGRRRSSCAPARPVPQPLDLQHHAPADARLPVAQSGLRELVRRGRARARHLQSVGAAFPRALSCRRASPRPVARTATPARSGRIPTPTCSTSPTATAAGSRCCATPVRSRRGARSRARGEAASPRALEHVDADDAARAAGSMVKPILSPGLMPSSSSGCATG